jgi:hypothetical protein
LRALRQLRRQWQDYQRHRKRQIAGRRAASETAHKIQKPSALEQQLLLPGSFELKDCG